MSKKENIVFWFLAVSLLSLLTRVYLPSFNTPFHFDDQHAIVENGNIRSLDNIGRFFTDPRTISVFPSNQVYRPISTLSIAVDYYLAGRLDRVVFHRSMYIVFCLQLVAMIFLFRSIIKKILPAESECFVRTAALVTTTIFGYNTCLAETLNYTVSRSDSYSTFFAVLTLAMFAQDGWAKRYYIYLLPLALGALTKETGATVPGLIFAYGFLISKSGNFWSRFRAAAIETIPSAMVIIAYLILYICISIVTPPPGTTKLHYFVTQIYVTAHYFLMFFLPVNLSADSGLSAFTNLFDDRVLLGAVLHLCLIALIIKGALNKSFAPLSFGLIWFYIALAPTSSVIPIEDVQNDHRMFYPFVGIAIALGWSAVLLFKRSRERFGPLITNILLMIVSVGYLTGHSYGLTIRHQVWSSKERLWRDVVIKNPNNVRGMVNYGNQLLNRKDYVGARKLYNKALKIWPNHPYTHLNLAIVNGAENLDADADREFQLANRLNPNNPIGYLFYARWLKSRHRYKEALANVDKVLNLSPNYVAAKELRERLIPLAEN